MALYVEPGFYSTIRVSPSLIAVQGGVQIVGLIGKGKFTKTVLEEEHTRLADAQTVDSLTNEAVSITKVFSQAVFKYPASSYTLSVTGNVGAASFNVTTKTFIVKINGITYTTTFTTSDPIAIATLVSQINAVLTTFGTASVAPGNFLRVRSPNGQKIQIGAGTANADLGFTEDQYADGIDWQPSIGSADPLVRPQEDDVYFVDYETPKSAAADDFKPKIFFREDVDSIINTYGAESTDNTLTLAAKLSIANGASILKLCQIDPDVSELTAFKAALSEFEKEDCDYIVPLTTNSGLTADVIYHVDKMSSKFERRERRALLSLDETSALEDASTWISTATGIEDARVALLLPGKADVLLDDVQTSLDGSFLCAAVAGLAANPAFDPAEPLTRKAVAGFVDIPDTRLRTEKNLIAQNGVMIVEKKGTTLRVRDQLTTDMSTIASQEWSITGAADLTAKTLRDSLEETYVGTKLNPLTTPLAVKASANTILLSLVNDQIISSFGSIDVKVDSTDPRQVDIKVNIIPIFPFKRGDIEITVVASLSL